MREIEKITQLFAALQDGDCWTGVNMQQALSGIDARMAVRKQTKTGNSIWQLVNHLVYWRKTVMNRLAGAENKPLAMTDFYLPPDTSETAWQDTLQQFSQLYAEFRQALLLFDESKLDAPSARKEQSNYQLLMGCLQHDCYHMGQMVLLKKSFAQQ